MTGIALQTSFVTFGVDFGLLTIVVGHATFCIVIAYNNVVRAAAPPAEPPEEASADLGADMFTSFRRITLPGMGTALVSGALLAFALSFDEIIVTNFTAGAATQTPPALDLSRAIQRPTELPVVNVVALVSDCWSHVVPVYIATRISGESARVQVGGRFGSPATSATGPPALTGL